MGKIGSAKPGDDLGRAVMGYFVFRSWPRLRPSTFSVWACLLANRIVGLGFACMSLREIARAANIGGKNTVARALVELEQLGYIVRMDMINRRRTPVAYYLHPEPVLTPSREREENEIGPDASMEEIADKMADKLRAFLDQRENVRASGPETGFEDHENGEADLKPFPGKSRNDAEKLHGGDRETSKQGQRNSMAATEKLQNGDSETPWRRQGNSETDMVRPGGRE